MSDSIFYLILSVFSSVIISLLGWIIKKITSIESKMAILEERISWVIKLMNSKDSE